jgi:hypothetical protein
MPEFQAAEMSSIKGIRALPAKSADPAAWKVVIKNAATGCWLLAAGKAKDNSDEKHEKK